MTATRCPCCGSELAARKASAARRKATSITNRWETLSKSVGKPGTIATMMKGKSEGGPTWWLPSLAYLAYQSIDRADARAALDEFASRRDELGYAVIEERTDDVIGFSIQPWPLLDDSGRLRFPIETDPIQLEVADANLAALLSTHRQRWHELGLLQEELVERRVQIGDAYAVVVSTKPDSSKVLALPESGEKKPRYVGGLAARRRAKSVSVPILDITWDAREAGKLAHYAAAAGVMIPNAPEPAMAAVTEETEARYMVAFRDGVHPRDVPQGEAQ